MSLLKNQQSKAISTARPSEEDYKDEHGIVYLGSRAQVRVAVTVKMGQDFSSAGMEAAIEFDTPAHEAKSAIQKASKKLRAAIGDELRRVIKALERRELDRLDGDET